VLQRRKNRHSESTYYEEDENMIVGIEKEYGRINFEIPFV
jgi:hypothetical protein